MSATDEPSHDAVLPVPDGATGGDDPSKDRDLELAVVEQQVASALFPRRPSALTQRIGRFVVERRLGAGAMGVVYAARDPTLDRRVAIKLVRPDVGCDRKAQLRLEREARALAKLSHPNIVAIHEVGEHRGQLFLAMEHVQGQTLREWQERGRRSIPAVLAMYVQAGRGLAAAHAAGLVHRDFKPDNVLVDDDGRARVLDFGLVSEDAEARRSELARWQTSKNDADVLTTRTHAMVGTPAYMSPEQFRGKAVDARSDQFAFCVALWEALHGERPFDGSSMMVLVDNVVRGRRRAAPKDRKVPSRLRLSCERGLATDPEQRWPSMDALLEELRRLAAPRHRRWMALGVTVGLVAVGGGVGATQTLEWLSRCTGARKQLEGVWDDARRQEVKAAIVGTGLSYAPGTWERVEPRIDEYAEAWVTEHTEACEATRSRGEQSEEEMSLRMECLREQGQHLRATVNELAHADATVVENAVKAVASLPGLERCRDLEALRTEVPPPEDPAVAEQVARLAEQMVETKAKYQTGRYAEGLRLLDHAVARAVELEYEPLMARAWLQQGFLREATGDYEGAVTVLRQAYGAAVARRMTAEAASASSLLVFVLGDRLARSAEARSWTEHAEALSRAVGTDEASATHLSNRGTLASAQGNYEEARDLQQRALALKEKALGPDHPSVAASLNNLGNVVILQGNYEDARDLLQRALALDEKVLGPDHPSVARSLDNLGNVAYLQGKHEQARELFERALAIKEKALGPDHPSLSLTLHNLGNVASSQGRYEEARGSFERGLAIDEKLLGPDHPDVAGTLDNLGSLAYSQGKHERARELFERALAIKERARGPDHPDVAASLNNLGAVAMALGNYEEARESNERALAIWEKALRPDHPHVATSLDNLGGVASELGKHEQARDLHERALAIREKELGPDHPDVAMSLNNLGNAVYELGKHEQARDLYERAIVIWDKALGPDHPLVAYPLTGFGTALLALGKPSEALATLERALTLRTTHEGDASELARTRFVLARALWDAPEAQRRDRPRALALAEQARESHAAGGEARKSSLAEVEAWLAEHRLPSTP